MQGIPSPTPSGPRPNDFLTRPGVYQGLFTPVECAQILGLTYPVVNEGKVYRPGGTGVEVDTSIRRVLSRVVEPLPAHAWIFDRVRRLFALINDSCYHFQLTGFSPLQVLEYQPEGFYDWHIDLGAGEISTRKLSCVVFLSPPEDYDGGKLRVESPRSEFAQEQGNAVVFPSYLIHRVEPVTRGQRWTLVAWAHGDAFR